MMFCDLHVTQKGDFDNLDRHIPQILGHAALKNNTILMPGNVVRGNQKLCKGNLYGCNRP